MVKRNLTVPFEFVCFTEDKTDIDPTIIIKNIPISPQISGWWYKPMFFNPKIGLEGTILFLDLDIIVFKNIDKLFTHKPGEFLIIRDFNRCAIKNYNKFNSSVFRLSTGQHSYVYDNFIKNPTNVIRQFHGDQDWIRASIKTDFDYWPDEWIQSYKWEMRGKPRMIKDANRKLNFEHPGHPNILLETSIAVFHGEPNPHNSIDPWCKENWK
tara:strand:- start:792 stop:1424 length:633 start_codon:yes stop_codon:yes gene_type:complete